MGDDIASGWLSMAVCFDFRSTNLVQLGNRNPYFYRFRCHHPLITQLTWDLFIVTLSERQELNLGKGRRQQTLRIRHVHSRTPQSATFYVSTQRPETTGGCRRPWPQLCFLEVRATLLLELPNFVQQLPSGP